MGFPSGLSHLRVFLVFTITLRQVLESSNSLGKASEVSISWYHQL